MQMGGVRDRHHRINIDHDNREYWQACSLRWKHRPKDRVHRTAEDSYTVVVFGRFDHCVCLGKLLAGSSTIPQSQTKPSKEVEGSSYELDAKD